MSQKATSIKFYCMVPKFVQGKLEGHEYKSTYHAAGPSEALTYDIDTGATGLLTVTVGTTRHVYKLADILGRIEVQL